MWDVNAGPRNVMLGIIPLKALQRSVFFAEKKHVIVCSKMHQLKSIPQEVIPLHSS